MSAPTKGPTPGPWTIASRVVNDRDTAFIVRGADRTQVAHALWAAHSKAGLFPTSAEEAEANARLISLAPEMAAYLRDIEWEEWDRIEGPTCPECSRYQRFGHTPDCRLGTILKECP